MTVAHTPRMRHLVATVLISTTSLAFGPPVGLSSDFALPTGVAIDGTRVVVNDTFHQLLKSAPRSALMTGIVFSPHGATPVGPPAGARLGTATGITSNGAGSLFVVDRGAREVQRFDWDMATNTYVDQPGFTMMPGNTADGVEFAGPSDIAIDALGNLFLLDTMNHRVVRSEPPYTNWTVWRADPSWPTCTGLDVNSTGDHVFLACNGDLPLIEVPSSGPWRSLGLAGTRDGELFNPQDVAIYEGLLLVADTNNARVELLDPTTGIQTHVVTTPICSQPNRIAVQGDDVFITDASRAQLIVLLSGGTAAGDVYVRDSIDDDGTEPSLPGALLNSPDIVVRQSPDIDLALASASGLHTFPSQEPRTNTNNYVYVAVRNRRAGDALGVAVQLFTATPGSALTFPAEWNSADFFRHWDTPMLNEQSNLLTIDRVPGRSGIAGDVRPGYRVIGPLIWRPTAPRDVMTWDGRTQLLVRLVYAGDETVITTGEDALRVSNNLSRREVTVRRAPPAVGTQNTLVVRVTFSDSTTPPPDEGLINMRLTEASAWLTEVSRGQSALGWEVAGPFVLSHPRSFYATAGQDPLVELTGEAIRLAEAERPGRFDGLIPEDHTDDITRVVVVLDDVAFPADRATTNTWPYEVGGRRRDLTTSVHQVTSALPEWAHGFSHHLGLKDLHPWEPTVDLLSRTPFGWDVMARPVDAALTAVHPLGFTKSTVPWLGPGDGLRFVPRPATLFDETVQLVAPSQLFAPSISVIALGLTPGVTDVLDEQHFVVIEARRNDLGDADQSLSGSGVLVYRYDRDIPHGQAPVLLTDARPATATLADAQLELGVPTLSLGFGIDVSLLRELGADGREGFEVRVRHLPTSPVDLGFTPQEYEWESADLWVDSPLFDQELDAQRAMPVEEQPQRMALNYVYARVHNYSDVPAYDVEVQFLVSDPMNTIGGAVNFTHLSSVIVPVIPPRSAWNVRTAWTPTDVDDPHRCLKAQLRRVVTDPFPGNDFAQQNVQVANVVMTSGRFDSAQLDAVLRNADPTPKRVYYRLDGPRDWTLELDVASEVIAPGVQVQRKMVVQPPSTAPKCTSTPVRFTSWARQRDTLERLGGSTLRVDLREAVQFNKPKLSTTKCDPKRYGNGPCELLLVEAQSTWPKKQKVTVRFEGESGAVHFRTFTTDALGDLKFDFAIRSGGLWNLELLAEGDVCHQPAALETGLWLALPVNVDQDKDGVPDAKELTGDADRDGLENVLDPDSDDDQRGDGQEQPGDDDKDGTPNVNDADS